MRLLMCKKLQYYLCLVLNHQIIKCGSFEVPDVYENERRNKLFVVQNDSHCSWICPYTLCYGLIVWLWTWRLKYLKETGKSMPSQLSAHKDKNFRQWLWLQKRVWFLQFEIWNTNTTFLAEQACHCAQLILVSKPNQMTGRERCERRCWQKSRRKISKKVALLINLLAFLLPSSYFDHKDILFKSCSETG